MTAWRSIQSIRFTHVFPIMIFSGGLDHQIDQLARNIQFLHKLHTNESRDDFFVRLAWANTSGAAAPVGTRRRVRILPLT